MFDESYFLVKGLIRRIEAYLFRGRELVSGMVTPSRQSSTILGGGRVSVRRRHLSSVLKHATSMDILAGKDNMPEQMRRWPQGRRQSYQHSLPSMSNHDAETGLLLENRSMHPAKLSSVFHTLDDGLTLLPHHTAAPIQIADRPPAFLDFFSR